MSFSSFGPGRSAPQRERETFSPVFPASSLFCFLFPFFFLFWRQISGIKYGSHMLLLTIGIQHSVGPTATQTGGRRERERGRRRVAESQIYEEDRKSDKHSRPPNFCFLEIFHSGTNKIRQLKSLFWLSPVERRQENPLEAQP